MSAARAPAPEAAAPRVGIGLPVYNGERFLAAAVDSILAQSFGDFELLIVDNASTDGTEAIARGFAARDPRVRYVRNPENIGAAPNFNRAFELSRGEYFKWAAHDDVCEPAFLERCVEALDADPSAVLAFPRTRIVDEGDRVVEDYPALADVESPRAVERFRSLARMGHKRFEVFGLIRSQALRDVGPMGSYASGDCVLVARLALRGRFLQLPEPLLRAREHSSQSMQMTLDFYAYTVWFDPRRGGRLLFPRWRVLAEYLRSLRDAPLAPGERLRCAGVVARWAWSARRWLRGELKVGLLHWLGVRDASARTQPRGSW